HTPNPHSFPTRRSSDLATARRGKASHLQYRAYSGKDVLVNLTDFPQCAAVNCVKSDALSPSRLGCTEQTLTTSCLCETAVKPLACSPSGPSDQDSCWYNLENWFAGVCGGIVPK